MKSTTAAKHATAKKILTCPQYIVALYEISEIRCSGQIDARQATAGRSTSFVFVFCEVMVSTEELNSHSKAAGVAAADGFAFVPIRTAFLGGNRLGCRT